MTIKTYIIRKKNEKTAFQSLQTIILCAVGL